MDKPYSNIEVVSRQYAWNEDIPGAEIIPGRGKATPMPDAVQERLIGGFFHSDQMHVIEKLTRKGNKIRYEVTVDEPASLVEPWVMTPRMLTAEHVSRRGTAARARQLRGLRDEGHQLPDSTLEAEPSPKGAEGELE